MEIPQKELEKFQDTSHEQCGILVGTSRITKVVEVKNIARNTEEDYIISIADVEEVESGLADGEVILGFLHTHLPHHGSGPSDTDFDGSAVISDTMNVVYQPSTGSLVWYHESLAEGN